MKYLKIFEDFNQEQKKQKTEKVNNITIDDLIECAKNGGVVYATIVKNFPNNDPKEGMRVVSVDDKNELITVEFDGKEYEINLDNVEKIEY